MGKKFKRCLIFQWSKIIYFNSRNCTDIQHLFLNLSTKLTKEILEGEGLKDWIKFKNNPQRCRAERAWEEDENVKPNEYHSCTLAIAKSVDLHLENIRKKI